MNSPSASPPEAVLEMVGLGVASVHAPTLVVVDDVKWTVRRGEYWILGGRSASGKSDMLATGAGLLRPHHGTHRLFGFEITHMHEEERLAIQLRVGMVFGSGGRLFSHLTVRENLSLPICYHRNCDPEASGDRVQSVLETLDLVGVAEKTPALLHQSLQQRVGLGRALVLKPELLFLDNPLASVDPREARWWLDFLDALSQGHPLLGGKGLTLVTGTDHLDPWLDRGHKFAVIHNRRFIEVGGRGDLAGSTDPRLRELLPAD